MPCTPRNHIVKSLPINQNVFDVYTFSQIVKKHELSVLWPFRISGGEYIINLNDSWFSRVVFGTKVNSPPLLCNLSRFQGFWPFVYKIPGGFLAGLEASSLLTHFDCPVHIYWLGKVKALFDNLHFKHFMIQRRDHVCHIKSYDTSFCRGFL